MVRKKARRGAVVSSNCFRLVHLKLEVQNDAKVAKPVVNEVDVLRLCKSLGMAVSDERDQMSTHRFEFGLFDPSKYDADFARFLRETLTQRSDTEDKQRQVDIGCLFGKQEEVKAELGRMGLWSVECEANLRLLDHGVYCIERSGDGDGRRQLVVFAWISAAVFEPEFIRDTPAYILRFLMSLSTNITCCLSREDFHHIRRENHSSSQSASQEWDSLSVEFRVGKQEEQSDNVHCVGTSKVSIPHSNSIEGVTFVGGAFPAIAVETSATSTTIWDASNEVVNADDFAPWLMKKYERCSVQLPSGKLRPELVRSYVLETFAHVPKEELELLKARYCENSEKAQQRIDREVKQYVQEAYDSAVRDVHLLFAMRHDGNSSGMDMARNRYNEFVHCFEEHYVYAAFDDETCQMLHLPERLQENMMVLRMAFENGVFEKALHAIVNDTPVNRDEVSGSKLQSVWGAMRRYWRGDERFSTCFRRKMEQTQVELQKVWLDTVLEIKPKLENAMRDRRVWQSTEDRKKQFDQDEEGILDTAYEKLRYLLTRPGECRLAVKISSLRFTPDPTGICVKWSEEVQRDPAREIHMYQLNGNTPIQLALLGTVNFEPDAELRKLVAVKTGQVIAVLVKDSTTIVRRLHFPLQLENADQLEAEAEDVRTFRHSCSLCSIRASDRRVAFVFGEDVGRLGSVAFCRFNEAFTSIEATRTLDMDATFRLAAPLADILLTDQSLCVLDGNGCMQSFDIRTRQTSKQTSFDDSKSTTREWKGGLLSFTDELVLARTRINEKQQLCVNLISSEDHRHLPSVPVHDNATSENFAVGSLDDMLYVVDGISKAVYATELNVTVRSEAYRIQRSGVGAKRSREDNLQCQDAASGTEHWLQHDEEGKTPSYCVLDAWHPSQVKLEIDDGFSYVDGHKFECVHVVDSGTFHDIFVLDSSGSMSGQPWTNLVYACREFSSNRWSDGGQNDVVSYVTFSNHSQIHCEATPLGGTLEIALPFSGSGTSFEEGLRGANEVLSRNDFEKYTPVLIFFSYGNPCDINRGIVLAQHIRSAYAKYDLKAFVVGFGRLNLPVLERMTAEMGGEYRHVLNGSELRMEFQRIAAVMRQNDSSLVMMDE